MTRDDIATHLKRIRNILETTEYFVFVAESAHGFITETQVVSPSHALGMLHLGIEAVNADLKQTLASTGHAGRTN